MEKPDIETLTKWHRWFGVECNNASWSLLEKDSRSAAEDREMLASAYAAAFHWSKVGQPVNTVRADSLLAHVHAALGHGAPALQIAQRCLSLCLELGLQDWDLASAHTAMAIAAAAAKDAALHAQHYAEAKRQGEAIKDAEDRKIFFEGFQRIPARV